jgi:hypothetical protein
LTEPLLVQEAVDRQLGIKHQVTGGFLDCGMKRSGPLSQPFFLFAD